MKLLKNIFTALFIVVFTTTNVFAARNCNNAKYRRTHPNKCRYQEQYYTNGNNTVLTLIGGAALIGVGAALAMQKSGNSGSSSEISNQSSFPRLTLSQNIPVNYDQNDTVKNQRVSSYYANLSTSAYSIDSAVMAEIKTSAKYQQNKKQYDAVNYAAATARNLTGKNVTINIVDDFASNHGSTVKDITKNIAPSAHINTYNIATNPQNLSSFDYIANTIHNAKTANIYNASWQIESTNSQNASTVIYSQNSIKTYAQAQQYLYNITSENFITQIRNTAIDNDAIFVWAAGNDSKSESGALSALPIAFPELQGHFVNTVSFDPQTGKIAWYSNKCGITQNYCIAAPGSAWNTDSSDFASGTSFTAPVISGAIATIKEAFPYMNASQITQLLFTTAQDLGETGVDEVYGWGLLDMEKATRPVGEARIILSNDTILPLSTTNIGGSAAGALKNANIKIAFVDDFGRAFTTNLSDNINIIPYGRGFDRLREQDTDSVKIFGGFEFGVKRNNILESSGLISTQSDKQTNFIGYNNDFKINDITFYQNVRLGTSNPKADENSIVSNFSNIYTSNVKIGTKWKDFAFEIAVPDTILYGNMYLNIPVNRISNGEIVYTNQKINLVTKPSMEYTLKYKYLSMTYVNNPDYQDEFFIMAKGRFAF